MGLAQALRRLDAGAPEALVAFDRVVDGGAGEGPDLHELSMRVGPGASLHRLTSYFDTHRRGGAVAAEAGRRLARLARAFGFELPGEVEAFVTSRAVAGDDVLQVVLGVEALPSGVHARHYLVFRKQPGRTVSRLLAAAGVSPPAGVDLARVAIAGLDVDRGGVQDVKLYFRLEAARVPSLLSDPAPTRELLASSREVLFQQGAARANRRRLYLHATGPTVLRDRLRRPALDEALSRGRAVEAHLPSGRLEPWIVSFPYEERRLDLDGPCVYFHHRT